MDLEQLAAKKAQTENDILIILQKFQEETQLSIDSIDINSVSIVGYRYESINEVKLDIRL